MLKWRKIPSQWWHIFSSKMMRTATLSHHMIHRYSWPLLMRVRVVLAWSVRAGGRLASNPQSLMKDVVKFLREVVTAPEKKGLRVCHLDTHTVCPNTCLGFPAHWVFLRASMGTPKSISIQLLDSEVCKTHAKVPCEDRRDRAVVWLYLEVVFPSKTLNVNPPPNPLFFGVV